MLTELSILKQNIKMSAILSLKLTKMWMRYSWNKQKKQKAQIPWF